MTEINHLSICLSPKEFFREQVSAALIKQNVDVEQDVEFYLVNLLCNFINPMESGMMEGNTNILDIPLAIQLKNALEAPIEKQPRLYQRMADSSLYIAGYFQDYFNRKAFDVGYFITLGSNAYESLGNMLRDRGENRSETFYKLAGKFDDLVEVYAIISDQLSLTGAENILATYDRWTKNQSSDRLRRKLEESGICPIPTKMKIAQ